jgi:tungstate transport system substrate-binding protein
MTLQSLIRRARVAAMIVVASLSLVTLQVGAEAPPYKLLLVGSTSSPEHSGLFAHLLPLFTRATGIHVRVIALGTGRALDLGRRGDVDVLVVHDRIAEDKFIAEGFGLPRRDFMYNDFILVGPKSDPAKARGRDIVAALARIAASPQVTFLSRGDESGTHAAELRFWKAAGIKRPKSRVARYDECDCGMGPALGIAASRGMYLLADRATWISLESRGDLGVVVEGDNRLFNQYGVIVVNPQKHRQVKGELGNAFADWVVSPEGQQAIASYKIGGEQLYFPNAAR